MRRKALLCLAAVAAASMLFSGSAMAAEDETYVLDTSMMDEELFEGSWVSAFNTFDMYLPNEWLLTYNAEEGDVPEDDVYFLAASEDGLNTVMITYEESEMHDLETLYATCEEAEAAEVAYMELNGIPGVSYFFAEDDMIITGLGILMEDGGLYNIVFTDASEDTAYSDIDKNIACSIDWTAAE